MERADHQFTLDQLQSETDPDRRGAELTKIAGSAIDEDGTAIAGLLPPEGNFSVILVDALAGNDRVTVGPTVQKSVWVDAGAGTMSLKSAAATRF
ncbi:MAG: hypothetical protein R3C05_14605 [Pirellulaceae bacterium]